MSVLPIMVAAIKEALSQWRFRQKGQASKFTITIRFKKRPWDDKEPEPKPIIYKVREQHSQPPSEIIVEAPIEIIRDYGPAGS